MYFDVAPLCVLVFVANKSGQQKSRITVKPNLVLKRVPDGDKSNQERDS